MKETDRLIRPCVLCKYHRIDGIGYILCTRKAKYKINRVHGDIYVVGETMCEEERASFWQRSYFWDGPLLSACGMRGKFFSQREAAETNPEQENTNP
jgi:hypothetical protein